MTGSRRPDSENIGKAAFAGSRKNEGSAGIAPTYPAEIAEALEKRRAERSGDMGPALAPVDAGPAQFAAALSQLVEIDPEIAKQWPCAGTELASDCSAPLQEFAAELDRNPSGKMVVAGAKLAHGRIARTWRRTAGSGERSPRDVHLLEQLGDVGGSDTMIAMAALPVDPNHARGDELREMAARGLRGNAAGIGKLTGGPCPSIEQCDHHVDPGRVSEKRTDLCDCRGGDHQQSPIRPKEAEFNSDMVRSRPNHVASSLAMCAAAEGLFEPERDV
jgi:hypothetical protein